MLFPAPLCSYTVLDPDLVWIPRESKISLLDKIFKNKCKVDLIPCFFIPFEEQEISMGGTNILIYFHANGEDLGISYEFLIGL